MNWFQKFFRKPEGDDTAEEMRAHIDLYADELQAQGWSAADARREARVKFGNPRVKQEEVELAGASRAFAALRHDVRFGFRLLQRNPAFATAAIVPLAIALAATATAFSVADAVLLQPLPYLDADRIVQIGERHSDEPEVSWADRTIGAGTIEAWRRESHTLALVAPYNRPLRTFDAPDERVRLQTAAIDGRFFEVLGIPPAIGRYFREEDEAAEAARPTTVISHRMWHQYFQADAAIVGRGIVLDGRDHLVIGVAPETLRFPGRNTQLWTLMKQTGPGVPTGGDRAIARLRQGASPTDAAAEGTVVARRVRAMSASAESDEGHRNVRVEVSDLATETAAPVRQGILLLLGATLMVLCAAALHVAHLLLIQTLRRTRELAVRAALGASSQRLIFSLLVTSLLIGVFSGTLALMLTIGSHAILPSILPTDFPRLEAMVLRIRTIAALAAAAFVAMSACAAVVAWHLSRRRILAPFAASRVTGPRIAGRSLRGSMALLTGEVAFSCALLIVAGLLGRSFVGIVTTDSGYTPSDALSAQLVFPRDMGQAERLELTNRLLPRLRALPAVIAAGTSSAVPLEAVKLVYVVKESAAGAGGMQWNFGVISPGYLEAIGARITRGRPFNDGDRQGGSRVALISEALVRRFYADREPLGLQIPSGTPDKPITAVGVVSDVRMEGPTSSAFPTFYVPQDQREQTFFNRVNVVMRTTGDSIALAATLRDIVRSTDRRLALADVTTLEERFTAWTARPRLYATTLAACAALATLIVALGLFGVLTFAAAQRRREMAIRVAVGATPSGIARLLLRDATIVVATGMAMGLLAGAGAGRALGTLLHDVKPVDPLTFTLAPLVLLVVALAAAAAPIAAAVRGNIVQALRSE